MEPRPDRPTRVETASPGVPRPDGRPLPIQPGATDLDVLSRDAAIATLNASDAPIAKADDLVAAVTGGALKAIVAARLEIFLQGHTPDNDEFMPLPFLPFEAQQHSAMALAQIGTTPLDRDLPAAEHELALTAAFCMAAIDRLRTARGGGGCPDGGPHPNQPGPRLMARPLMGRRPKRKPAPDRVCMTVGCGAKIASWKWLCDDCFGGLPFLRKKEICEARAARMPQRVFGLSRDAGEWLAAQRAKSAGEG